MIYFVVYLFLEVVISVNISSFLGGLITFFEILLSAFIGVFILINFRHTLKENFTAVSYNCIDLQQFQNLNLFTLIGAILLVVPGFLTDIIGSLMQFSAFTTMLVNHFYMKSKGCKRDYTKNNQNQNNIQNNIQKDINVIDVEIVNDNGSIK